MTSGNTYKVNCRWARENPIPPRLEIGLYSGPENLEIDKKSMKTRRGNEPRYTTLLTGLTPSPHVDIIHYTTKKRACACTCSWATARQFDHVIRQRVRSMHNTSIESTCSSQIESQITLLVARYTTGPSSSSERMVDGAPFNCAASLFPSLLRLTSFLSQNKNQKTTVRPRL